MLQANVAKRQKRKLPVRKIVDAELVSSKADSDRVMDDLLFPSEKDRIILNEIFDSNKESHVLNLPRVVLGVPKKRELKKNHTISNNKSYKERLKEQYDASEHYLDLSGHSIIPTKNNHHDHHTKVTTETVHRNNQEELDSEIEELNIHHNNNEKELELHENDTRSHKELDAHSQEELDTHSSKERIHQREVDTLDTVQLEKEVDSDNGSHRYEQQVYVVIESLDKEDSSDYSSSEPENGSLYESDISDESIKQQDTSVKMNNEDTLIQLPKPKLSANIPFSQDIKTQEDAEIDTDSDIQDTKDVVKETKETIATVPENTMGTVPDITIATKSNNTSDSDVPDKTMNTSKMKPCSKHAKLKRLRCRKALDWTENTSITNTSPKVLSGRISKIAYRRKERLSARRNKPYITKKNFKTSVWE